MDLQAAAAYHQVPIVGLVPALKPAVMRSATAGRGVSNRQATGGLLEVIEQVSQTAASDCPQI